MNDSRKDTYELLSMSDSDSDTPQQIQELNFKSPRRKRLRKKLPSYRIKRYDESSGQQCCHSYGKQLSLSFIIVILCCWLLILSWLVMIFNDELKRFDENSMQCKKMRKRRELDALVAANGLKRYSGYAGGPVCVKPGTNYHDQLLSESSDEPEDYWRARSKANHKRSRTAGLRKRCTSVLGVCTLVLVLGCVIVTTTMLWLFLDIRHQANYLQYEIDQVASSNMPESLQKCRQETKELQRNQSDLYSNFVKLNSKLTNLSSEISVISRNLSAVRSKLNDYNDLYSWIKKVNDTVAQLQISEMHLKNFNLTSPKENSSVIVPTTHTFSIDPGHLMNDSPNFISLVNKLTENITYINNSLNSEIQLMKEEYLHDHEALQNLSSFTYNNVSHRLSFLEKELSGISHKLNIVSSSSSKADASDKTSSTVTDNSKVLPEEEKGKP